jgi:hypothetical protein
MATRSRRRKAAPKRGNRTRKGNVKASAYKKYGNKRGKFPIFDAKSARSALRLRGHAKTSRERSNIISRAAKYLPAAAKRARAADRKRS